MCWEQSHKSPMTVWHLLDCWIKWIIALTFVLRLFRALGLVNENENAACDQGTLCQSTWHCKLPQKATCRERNIGTTSVEVGVEDNLERHVPQFQKLRAAAPYD